MKRVRTLLVVGLLIATTVVVGPVAAQDTSAPLDDAITLATEHLAEQFPTGGDVSVVVTDAYTSEHSGVVHVYLRQTVNGLEVLGAEATVNVLDDVVIHSGNRFIEDLGRNAAGQQAVPADQAVAIAATDRDALTSDLLGTPRLGYRALAGGTARLAYDLELRTRSNWWHLSVDAQTGEVLYVADWVDSENAGEIAARIARPQDSTLVDALLEADGGQAVAVDTDALTAPAFDVTGTAPDDLTPAVPSLLEGLLETVATGTPPILPPEQFEDGSSYTVFPLPFESPLDGDRMRVANPADALASPLGWHDTGAPGGATTTTSGNNVDAYADTIQDNSADPGSQPDGGSDLQFDFPLLTTDATPLIYRDAAVTNLFYWSNVMHDITYRYGFDEQAGNFQVRNLTGLGEGADPVLAEAQDGGGVLNANFATPPDGRPGRMQMYLWVDAFRALTGDVARVPSTQVRDGDLESGVIAHEYGHGISNRLVGGPSNVACLRNHAERQGEGWSDWWSFALTMQEGDDGATPRGIGNYVIYHDVGRTGPGIRITPYSTDMSVNPSTYDRIRSAAAPHGVGYVWATMLWDMYWNLVDVHGFNPNPYDSWETGGNNLAIQLVVDGMKFSPCDPGFADARDAIIAADHALTGSDPEDPQSGEHHCLIWDTFARRGLGFSADQGDPFSKVDGVEGYDVPPVCEG
ncbi:hypothetical protein BH23ACT9_BH23ACT9_02890 [soil metagenome]